MRISARTQPGKVLDLFAGAGGWEEALRTLGLTALGVEIDSWACATARAAGHERLQADATVLDPNDFSPVWGLIGSPPCQAYSTAGKGLGRADRPLVIACANELAAGHDSRAVRLSECRDARSLLTVEPLRFALALKPTWIALEQVPAVLELWTLFAALLSSHGYQSAVGILSAERYGVPQTRKRAFLIASLDGLVSLPDPTHRSYNPRRQDTPQDELGLEPWVSMAEALGWTPSEEVGFPRRNDTPSNKPSKSDTGTYRKRDRRPAYNPAPTLTAKARSWTRVEIRRGGGRTPVWAWERPATTVACDRRVHPPGHKQNASDPPDRYEQRRGANAVRVTTTQAAVLQGFDPRYPLRGPRTRQFEQIGNAVPPPLALPVLVEAINPSDQGTRRRGQRRPR
jgi:DNA (cytosine-5)-methyltransferase 1